MLAGSSFLAPVFAGFINDGQGWQWVLVGLAVGCLDDLKLNFVSSTGAQYYAG